MSSSLGILRFNVFADAPTNWTHPQPKRRGPRHEEAFCWTIGYLVFQFWREFYKRVPHTEPRPRRQTTP